MTDHSNNSSIAAQLMAIEVISELLVSTSPLKLGETLTDHLRELSGARTVMILIHQGESLPDELLYVSPLRRANLFSPTELDFFCYKKFPETYPFSPDELPAQNPLKSILQQAGIKSMVRYPLHAGGEPIGQLLLFDLPGIERIEETSHVINLLAPPIALALKNSIAFFKIEQLAMELEKRVEERTTELRHKNTELQTSEERFRLAIQATDDGLWEWDMRTNEEFFSPRFCEIVGYRLDDPELPHTFSSWRDRIHPDDIDNVTAALKNHLVSGSRFDVIYRHRHKSGEYRWQRSFGQTTFDENGKPLKMVGCISDITESKSAEEKNKSLELQLQQAQKLESVGRLAGGVAHDFNNMLGVIMGHAEIGLMHLEPNHPVCSDLVEIRKAATKSADLTRQLLAFARKQTIAPRLLNLNNTVADMLKMLQRLIGENIHLSWQPTAEPCLIKVDPSQIDQILANLCINAKDAITGNGTIIIETTIRTIDEEYCSANLEATPGEYICLTVSDSGCGMDKETRARIFEPFYTTKELGKGTGLGLATVYGAVKQNNGFINIYSEPGQGTTFSIYLPKELSSNGAAMLPESDRTPDPRGRETILLVEDEPAILDIASTMLKKQGYTVLTANSPEKAINLAQEHSGEIQLLMTDVIMPEMNGRDLAKNLLSIFPHMKCLFMSGYTSDIIASQGVLEPGLHFIQKPFLLSTLATIVRTVLDREK